MSACSGVMFWRIDGPVFNLPEVCIDFRMIPVMITLVKRLPIIALLALHGFSPAAEPDASADPAAAAITHLGKIIQGTVNLDAATDTAISPHVSFTKKNEIRERLNRMAIDLKGGELEVGNVRIEGDLAGVIVHKYDGYDPDKVAAFAIGLVHTGERWMPAPVSASFENTGISLNAEMRNHAAELEVWMLRKRARALDTLRDEQIDLMRRDIATVITRKELETMSVGDMARSFLDVVRNGDRLRLLGMLGGLSDPLPRDWSARLRASNLAFALGDTRPDAWRLLASQSVLRAIIFEETSVRDGLFTIGWLDPAVEVPRGGVPGVDLFHIDMERDAGGAWRLNLPVSFMDSEGVMIKPREEDDLLDVELLDAFPKHLRKIHPARPQESAEAVWQHMRKGMASEEPNELLQLLALPEDDPAQARIALGRASRFWWQSRFANGGKTVLPLAFHQDGDQAMAMVQLYAFREPERTDLRAFHFIRLDEGWMWQSTGRKPPPRPVSEALIEWRSDQEERWRDNWITKMLEPVQKIQILKPGSPVKEDVAVALVRNLLATIDAEDAAASLANCAVLDDPEGHARLLRNLGYELSTRITEIDGEIITRTGNHWTVVCYRRRDDVNPGMALMPVITTPNGPRILLELDLFVGTRQREFLNNVALDRLEGYAENAVRADLQDILRELNREFAPRRK